MQPMGLRKAMGKLFPKSGNTLAFFDKADGFGPILLTIAPIAALCLGATVALTQGLIQKYGATMFFRICWYLIVRHK